MNESEKAKAASSSAMVDEKTASASSSSSSSGDVYCDSSAILKEIMAEGCVDEDDVCAPASSASSAVVSGTVSTIDAERQCAVASDLSQKQYRRRCRDAVMLVAACDARPLSWCESDAARLLCRVLSRGEFGGSSARDVDRALSDFFTQKLMPFIQSLVQKSGCCAAESDVWTERTGQPAMGLVLTVLDPAFDCTRSILCSLRPFPGHHSADEIKKMLDEQLRRCGIEQRMVVSWTGDNAANEQAGLREIAGRVPVIGCAAHTLHLAVVDALELVDDLLASVRGMASAVHMSHLRAEKLKAFFRDDARRKLQSDSVVRWSSALRLLSTAFESRPGLTWLADELGPAAGFNDLSELEWTIVGDIIEILEPVHEVSTQLQCLSTNLAVVLPRIVGLDRQQFTRRTANALKSDSSKKRMRTTHLQNDYKTLLKNPKAE